jgi:predicted MFS family arabinose efflux permease
VISRALAIRIFLSFAFGYFISYALRSVNAAIAPLLAADLNLSAGELGWLSSAFFLSFTAMQIPLGICLDRYGARRTESCLLLIAAGGALVISIGHSLWMVSLGRMLIGVGVAACLMAPYAYFRRSFAASRQPQLAMWMLIAGTSGALLATQPALLLAQWLGWRQFFVLAALLLAIAAALVFVWTGDHDRQTTTQIANNPPVSFLSLLTHPLMLRVIPTTIFFSGGFAALQSLWAGPWLTQVLHMTAVQAGEHLLYFNAALIVSYVAMSVLSPKLEQRGISLARQSLIAFIWFPVCLGTMLFWQTTDSWVMWIVLAPGVPAVILMQTQTALAFPRHMAGRVLTTFNLVMFGGAFGIQWGIGLLADWFGTWSFTPQAALTMAFACLVILQMVSLAWFLLQRDAGATTNAATPQQSST